MQTAGNMAAMRKPAHELNRISLLLQFVDDALESCGGMRGDVSSGTRFCSYHSRTVHRPQIRLVIIVSVAAMMHATNVVSGMMHEVVPLNVVRAMVVVPVSSFGR